ncbi:DUF6507 family protein [Streptomyces cinereospinus]|uniref:DUF6507 family protein n=1 Tax=Streptomyces cinereospinus TaxID=285561 RepID=A0ABV5MVB3_9ACTN
MSNFANDTQQKILFMAARTKKTMEGTVKATVEYVEGDLTMAADAQREVAAAPTPEELKAAAGKPDPGGEQPR